MRIPEPVIAQLIRLIDSRLGLGFLDGRDVDRMMQGAAHDLGFDEPAACARWLVSTPSGDERIAILARHFTVGETYFFRDRKVFEVLEREVLPSLAKEGRTIRVWSAGCSSGEEAYSLAILLQKMGIHAEILASDINLDALEKAKQGIYGEWSFRDCPVWAREGYFSKAGPAMRIDPEIRRKVTFFRLNLASDPFPSGIDLLFCRNVMMYFSPEKASELVAKLCVSVREGGWLAVSPAESGSARFEGMDLVGFGGALLYRKSGVVEALPVVHAVPAEIAPETVAPESVVPDAAEMARRCADRGELGEAEKWCRRAVEADRTNPSLHYLLATILHEKGDQGAEEATLRKVLYLDPDCALAHFALGNLRKRKGGEAAPDYSSALRLLLSLPRDEILPESGGISAGRLAEMVSRARG